MAFKYYSEQPSLRRPAYAPVVFIIAILMASAVTTTIVAAAPVSAWLDKNATTRLLAGEEIRASSTGRSAALSLAPSHPAIAKIRESILAEAPDVVVEALFLWKKPNVADPAAETLAIYNVLRAIGSLQGIEYWSASRGRMRLFYEYSSLIAGPENQAAIGDARLSKLPASPETLYARQKDLSFGDNRYRVSLSSGSGFVAQSSTNLTRMSYGIVPVAEPGAVNIRLLVVSADDGLIFYAASSARATIVPGVRAKLEASFGNRAAAVYAWFAHEISKTWPPH